MRKHLRKLALAVGAVALGLMTAPASRAAILNGGFEDFPDFNNWSTAGNNTIQDSTFKAPPEGTVQALLSTGTLGGTPGSASSLETFLGLSAGTLTGSANAKEGSAIKQTITVSAGAVITFKADFATNEGNNKDFAFVTVNNQLFKLYDTTSPSAATNPLDGINSFAPVETGYHDFSITFAAGGSFTLGFGAVDVGDTNATSGLLVDALVQGTGPTVGTVFAVGGGGGGGGAVPLPAGVFLMPIGLAVAGKISNKFRRNAAH